VPGLAGFYHPDNNIDDSDNNDDDNDGSSDNDDSIFY
jgi:hypothetical protein